jgi:hypothetical protein
MYTSIWSTCHDLEPTGEVEHVAGLHGTSLPALRNQLIPLRPGAGGVRQAGSGAYSQPRAHVKAQHKPRELCTGLEHHRDPKFFKLVRSAPL